jgi:TrmH family RNA methyltransferase
LLFKEKKSISTATLQNSTSYHTQDYTKPTALVVGTEATGLTQEWRDCYSKYYNPNAGEIDSMNVSVAAAILILKPKDNEDFKLHFDSRIK